MTQEMYSIKEAANALGVETHALRFWEEELGLSISRNQQGRRIYSDENMQEFRRIMEWKEQGLQLKAIKQLIHKGDGKRSGYWDEGREKNLLKEAEQMELAGDDMTARRIIMYRPKEVTRQESTELGLAQHEAAQMEMTRMSLTRREFDRQEIADLERAEKARRLQELLKQFIAESIRESNTELLQGLKDGLLKELDYQFRLQEEREAEREKIRIEKEDEHFRKLDENLRYAMEKRGKKKKRAVFLK